MSFEDYKFNGKSKTLVVCKNGMPLWIGLDTMEVQLERALTNKDIKDAIKRYPGSVEDCRCRDCRYFRIFGRK